ncbi:ketopantoate reductase family protein [Pinirhizobacter soli]|uniref:ketopantoate reductase family protein n=1 Tax=Pinirhizobacter soli TaxID=2786953 RepID=UPI00202AA6F3|nr:ketopantoate reductase family protein [Pinirhizobacter soli]
MRYLILGAGALGGFFGGRMLEAGLDTTFLVREHRAAALVRRGLRVTSPKGDIQVDKPPLVQADGLKAEYDTIVLSCKAYDLASAMEAIAPAVGTDTAIIPLLNGMDHIERLQHRFDVRNVLGGLSVISASLDAEGDVRHHNDLDLLSFGELDGSHSARVGAIQSDLSKTRFTVQVPDDIQLAMWEKWCFIASLAGINCLMRASVGEVVDAGGVSLALKLYDECAAVAAWQGFAPCAEVRQRAGAALTAKDSPLTASMLRDIQRGSSTEGEHILGSLLRRATSANIDAPTLEAATVHLRAYENSRANTTQG